MAKFYRFNNAVEHVHKPEDVCLDYFMHFWTYASRSDTCLLDSIQNTLDTIETPWLDTFMYCWVAYPIRDPKPNNA